MAEGQLTISSQHVADGSVTLSQQAPPSSAKAGIVPKLRATLQDNGERAIKRPQRAVAQGSDVVVSLDGLVRTGDELFWECA